MSAKAPLEGIYRRVSVRMYSDAKFMRLTPLQPSGQALWLYLLTGTHTGQISGVFVMGRAAMSEVLGWDPGAFDVALDQVIEQGMVEFDPKTRLWFIPKAIHHNMPANPNVVKSWSSPWKLLPECQLRDRIARHLMGTLAGHSAPFEEAFEGVIGKASGKASKKPLAKAFGNGIGKQEQQQEQQEHEQQKRDPPASRVPPAAAGDHLDGLQPEGSVSEAAFEPKRQKLPRPVKRCPAAFVVTDAMRAWASNEAPGVDLDAETAKLRDHEFAKGRSDWVATWRNWIRRAYERLGRNGIRPSARPSNVIDISKNRSEDYEEIPT